MFVQLRLFLHLEMVIYFELFMPLTFQRIVSILNTSGVYLTIAEIELYIQ